VNADDCKRFPSLDSDIEPRELLKVKLYSCQPTDLKAAEAGDPFIFVSTVGHCHPASNKFISATGPGIVSELNI
jgi:hypothetical protein